jgi:probable rRNA maturation factor
MPARSVAVANHHPRLQMNRRAVTSAILTLDTHREEFGEGCPSGELSLVFLTDAVLAQLHSDFLADPTTTDVITFEGNAAAGIAGEICVSVDTASRYAKDHRRDFSDELTLYLVHGWLHLAGFDDLKPVKKRIMRRAEARAMKLLAANRSVPTFYLR